MKSFYTRNGDQGETGLLGSERISKADLRMEVLGTIDELSAMMGFARSLTQTAQIKGTLLKIQNDLYRIMSELAATQENANTFRFVETQHVEWLEQQTDTYTELAGVPKAFILPGDVVSSAALDVVRTIVRRAERRIAQLNEEKGLYNLEILRYFNRLSSLCFAMELFENKTISGKDQPTLASRE